MLFDTKTAAPMDQGPTLFNSLFFLMEYIVFSIFRRGYGGVAIITFIYTHLIAGPILGIMCGYGWSVVLYRGNGLWDICAACC